MTDAKFTYQVYINDKPATVFETEKDALNYVESEGAVHRDADFVIARIEKFFDSSESSDDRALLYRVRIPNRSNAIYA